MNYNQVIQYLEKLIIMPKTMPGLDKIREAVKTKGWFLNLDPKKIITVAGTNGKGTTAAALETLLNQAGQRTGLYTSPHLVSTTERIRTNGVDVAEDQFVKIFLANQFLIEKYELSHFESLTLMASDYFYNPIWNQNLDFVIFEVGLGGLYDATNIFPNHYAVITKLGFDHENILGSTLQEIAKNKFGIVKNESVVIHHQLPQELKKLIIDTKNKTNSEWFLAKTYHFTTNLIGARAIENINTAITIFEMLGFGFEKYKTALNYIRWPGRMQKIEIKNILCPVYVSGDHNIQGIESLIEILKDFKYAYLHLIVGIGSDKACDKMLEQLLKIKNVKLYLTETPFKGKLIKNYPQFAIEKAFIADSEISNIFSQMKTEPQDLVIVTGSLYLVGRVLKERL